jgi:hypothetical protein
MALTVGSDQERAGVYSMIEMFKNLEMAQFIVDNDYSLDISSLLPPAPTVEVVEAVDGNGAFSGVDVVWDTTPEAHENFGGYLVWRASGKLSTGEYDWQLLHEFMRNDTSLTWPPAQKEGKNFINDPNVQFGYDYYYSVQVVTKEIFIPPVGVTATNRMNENSFYAISPATPEATETLDDVKVVPNPYIGSVAWNNPIPSDMSPWEHRLMFINLPADAKIRIYTLDGDFVKEIKSGESARVGEAIPPGRSSAAEWDLITRNNQEAAPGVYMYVVDSPSLGQKVGKFVIIR